MPHGPHLKTGTRGGRSWFGGDVRKTGTVMTLFGRSFRRFMSISFSFIDNSFSSELNLSSDEARISRIVLASGWSAGSDARAVFKRNFGIVITSGCSSLINILNGSLSVFIVILKGSDDSFVVAITVTGVDDGGGGDTLFCVTGDTAGDVLQFDTGDGEGDAFGDGVPDCTSPPSSTAGSPPSVKSSSSPVKKKKKHKNDSISNEFCSKWNLK